MYVFLIGIHHQKSINQFPPTEQVMMSMKKQIQSNESNVLKVSSKRDENHRCLKPVHLKPFTPWKINMEHNNGGLEDDFPFQRADF